MKRRQIPSGYISSFASHTDPAIAPPPPPIIEQKQAQTLMGHCLKEFIKQRLYGNMVNYTRSTNTKLVKFTPFVSSIQEDIISKDRSSAGMQTQQQRRLSQARQNIQKRMNKRYQVIVKNTKNQLQQQRGSYRHSLGNIQSSLIDSVRPRRNRSPITNKYSPNQQTQRSIEGGQRYKCSSFISAIQEEDSRESKLKKQQKKLIPIIKNRMIGDHQQDRAKNISKSPISPSRFDKQKFIINSNFWELVCKKSKKNENQLENSRAGMLAKDNSSTLIENKSIGSGGLSIMLGGKSGSQLPSFNPADKSKYFLNKLIFSKQLFQEYLSNSKYVVKRLAQFLLYFFEISNKVYDQMKIEDYKEIMEIIVTVGPRVWAVCAFRFWDVDQNGVICSSDIFKIFKELDQLKTQIQERYTDYGVLDGYKINDSLLKTVQKLRQITLQHKLEEAVTNISKNQVQFQIKYLEQSVLKRKQLKYLDLSLILGHNFKITTKEAKKSVIETTKQIRIKMSSCYRYSFLATDHNQQTRQDREQIQTLKQSLRKEKMDLIQLSSDQQIINKKISGIKYQTFVERQLYRPIKDLAYLIFGIQNV